MISIRRLAELDWGFHGKWFVLIEFGGAFLLLGVLAWIGLIRGQWHSLWGWYCVGVALNYLPLFLYSLRLAARDPGSTRADGEIDRTEVRRYTRRQFWLLVPFVVFLAAAWQEIPRRTR